MTEHYTLYGMRGSLYTGKVRAYMRYNQVPFKEVKAGSDHFRHVVAKEVGRWIIPVIETPDGEYIQDGSVILDYFEDNGYSQTSIYPSDPRLKVIAHLFELFGSEGLLRPAMHYRWNFDETNLEFLKVAFEDVIPDGLDDKTYEEFFLNSSGKMRKAAMFFGVTPEVQPTVEAAYQEFLGLFEAHMKERPFLLGGHPTIGDYGLFSPLYAHLARDPAPLHLMQTTAPRVHRWTERMNMSERYVDGTAIKAGDDLFGFEAIPDTLKALMRFVAEDYLPEITAHIEFTNNWLAENPDPATAYDPKSRFLGATTFEWRGHQISSIVGPYRNFLLQRVTDSFDALSEAHKADVRALFAEAGLDGILELRSPHRVVRKDYLEVWE
ncbi:MAG: glutathione S-transferase [Pseudomonadota bacterium]